MSATVLLKALGLNTQPNQLDPSSVPPGSLTTANNIIIKRDNVIESRRGYKLYGEQLGSSSDRATQLAVYKQRILRFFASSLEYDTGQKDTVTGEEIFTAFDGTYNSPEPGRRIRFIEAKSNFYFTTDRGIEKISAKTAADFTPAPGFIIPAGGINAVDFTATLEATTGNQTGFLQQDAAVAYRILWNYIDRNNNLIFGSPSQREVVTNSLLSLLLRDYMNLLGALDDTANNSAFPSLITFNQFVATFGLPTNATAVELQANLVNVATELDNNIVYADQVASAPLQISASSINGTVATVAFTNGSPNPNDYLESGQVVNLAGFTPTTGTMNGPQTISSVFDTFVTTGDTTSGTQQIVSVTTVADISGNLAGAYWTLASANNVNEYYIWYQVSGIGNDPLIPGKTGIMVAIATNDTANTVATNTRTAILGAAAAQFSIPAPGANTLTITNTTVGFADAPSPGTTTFAISTSTPGASNNVISNIPSTNGIFVGALVSGLNIPVNTYVTAIGANGPGTITISSGINVNQTGITLTFGPGFTFITSATGTVSLINATVNSHTFQSIPIPAVPNNPATDAQLVAIQQYLSQIFVALQLEPSTGSPPTISSDSQTKYISTLDITTSANVKLRITIPQGVTTNYFFQVYRSPQALATGPSTIQDISPSDELQLVFEGFPTQTDINNGFVIVDDITPDAFLGAFLYTDATNGTGILSALNVPPAALDMAFFKNVMFYANTRTKHRLQINLLGVSNMIADFNGGNTPAILITDGTLSSTYHFVTGLPEMTQITTTAAGTLNSSGPASYFLINSGEDINQYYVWYELGTSTDPMVANKTGIRVSINVGDTANDVASKTAFTIIRYNFDFNVSYTTATNVVDVTVVQDGFTTASSAGTTPFTVTQTQAGRGEDASTNTVLLSTSISPAQAVDETARSFVRIINENMNSAVYAYYLSGPTSVPGQISLEEKALTLNPFYVVANDAATGLSFNPDLSPDEQITSITTGVTPVVTTATAHNLINQDKVLLVNTNTTPIIDGLYTIAYISPTSFSISGVNVTVAGTQGAVRNAADAPVSDNEVLPNRIYYSQYLEPEGVPLLNTIDVGAKDKAILRIFTLRDSLFVFKEDGLFRISGESAPFNLALFDSSVELIAADSVDVSNNLIFAWTTKGIHTVSEAGVNIISRPIDNIILSLATEQYTNFHTATWGIGYESDNSYTVYTVDETTDTLAKIGYRYSTLTNSWTVFQKSCTCGVINPVDDKQYLGAGDTNFLEQERKDFTRYDYADREISIDLTLGNYFGNDIRLTNIVGITPGDVLIQNQYITTYNYNALLQKLDIDPTLTHTYFANQKLVAGVDLRTSLDNLITQIANDPFRLAQPAFTPAATYLGYQTITSLGTITNISATNPTVITSVAHGLQNGRMVQISGSNSTPSIDGLYAVSVIDADHFSINVNVTVPGTTGTFSVDNENFLDVLASFNGIIFTLNNDPAVAFSNYNMITEITVQESIITKVTEINNLTIRIDTNLTLDYFVGPLIIFKSIPIDVIYSPQTLNDPLGLKHMREATLMFENKAFTSAKMLFSTDLLPQAIPVPVPGDGNGIFGYSGNLQGFGSNFFGGASNSAPFRTYIPRNAQRCRYLICEFTHSTAREMFTIYGLTLTGEISQSTRAYR